MIELSKHLCRLLHGPWQKQSPYLCSYAALTQSELLVPCSYGLKVPETFSEYHEPAQCIFNQLIRSINDPDNDSTLLPGLITTHQTIGIATVH